MYNKLPSELKENGLFCLWRYEERDGKITKVPYRLNGSCADSTKKQDFADFRLVTNAVSGYDGIGMGVFGTYCAIDIDHCVAGGKLTSMAQDIVDAMNSYTEFSPSGTGIRIIFKVLGLSYDKKRCYINNRKIGLEVYVTGMTSRFVTLTGNAIRECDIEVRTTELMTVLEKYMVKTVKERKPKTAVPGSYLTDESVISKAMASKQGEKFKSLWNGTIPEDKSHSEADQALCTILAFWCGGDTAQMDRLFRQSGLMREKWERDDYSTATLDNAVAITTEFYKPIAVDSAADEFNETTQALAQLNPARNNRYRNGDIGFGRLFADVHKRVARYVPERKKWYIYDGSRWVPDIGGLMAMELCKELADGLLLYLLTFKDESVRIRNLEDYSKWQQRRLRDIYLKEAQSVYPVSMEEFDADRYLLNCENGTLDLRTMQFRDHDPEDRLTKMAHVSYDPAATCNRFERYIDEIMSGDTDRARFLQKALGYAVSGDTRHECMFFLYGETTRNGKGTLMESILRVVGDYGRAVRPETIAQKQNVNSQNPSEDIARLAGIRFANISEPSRGLVLNAAQVKSMTGNDPLNARFLNENSFDFQPQFKLYVNTNYLPVISDMTLFSSGRVLIIPFDRHFEDWEQDKTLKSAFAEPKAKSAILNWLLKGYELLRQEGFIVPKAVTEATLAYSHESNKIAQFADERLQPDTDAETRTAAVYDEYRRWCSDNGCYTENSRNFNHELRKFGTVVRRRPQTGGEKTTLLLGYKVREGMEFLK